MHHGCYHLCPKVREQLRKAHLRADEDPEKFSSSDSDLSVVAGPSKVQSSAATSKRSKDSKKYLSGAASPAKISKSSRRSHESSYSQIEESTSGRVGPTKNRVASRDFEAEDRSQPRSKDSQRKKEYPSKHETPGDLRSPEASRKFDPEKRSQRRSKDSQRTGEYPSGYGGPDKTPEPSIRFAADNPKSHPRSREADEKSSRSVREEQRSNPSSRTNAPGKMSQSGSAMKTSNTSQRKAREFDDGAGSSGKRRGPQDVEDKFEDYEESHSAHDLCDPHCRGINERMRKIRDEQQQQVFDEYLVNKGLPYFGDLCTCCFRCLAAQLWNDHFVNSTVTSAAVFVVGLKLCSDLNGWTVPNVF